MQMTDLLARMGGLQSVARELGVSEAQVASGADALLPAILGGFKRQAQTQPDGAAGLGGVLAQLGGGGLLDQVLSPQPTDVGQGNQVLEQIFGSRDVSRTVAQNASAQTGLDAGLLKKMLPLIAMLAAGALSKQAGGPSATAGDGLGGLGGMLGGLLGTGGARADSAGAGGRSAGGLGALLDLDGDGNALDDILGMAGKVLGR